MSGLDMVSLFEGEASTIFETIEIQNIQVCVQYIDEYPGASQSGYHLWPGARSMCDFLCQNWTTLCNEIQQENGQSLRVAELGSGMGLCGLCVAALGADSIELVLATDADKIILDRVLESFERTKITLGTTMAPLKTKCLRWGEDLEQLIVEGYANSFDLIIGSDLIYSDGLIKPILQTVLTLLNDANVHSKFILCYSFAGYKEEALNISNELNLELEVLVDTLKPGDKNGFCSGHRVECYTRKC
jgi:hypothetical protein